MLSSHESLFAELALLLSHRRQAEQHLTVILNRLVETGTSIPEAADAAIYLHRRQRQDSANPRIQTRI